MPIEKRERKRRASPAVETFLGHLQLLETEAGRRQGIQEFKPQPGDVIVATPAKCGTTMILQLAHSLRSRGDEDFEEINVDVCPCLEMAVDSGVDIYMDQRFSPRLFKTHSWYHYCPGIGVEGVKHVFVMRNPVKAAISFYHFLGGWFFNKDELSIDTFIQEFVLERSSPTSWMENASIWDTIASWYPHRNDENVLFLTFEYIVQHKRVHAEKVASFMGLEYDDDLLDIAVEQSSMEWMGAHPTKYDEHHLKQARNHACGLPADAGLHDKSTGKIRMHASSDSISDTTKEMLQEKWMETMYPVTGCRTYEQLCDMMAEELYKGWW